MDTLKSYTDQSFKLDILELYSYYMFYMQYMREHKFSTQLIISVSNFACMIYCAFTMPDFSLLIPTTFLCVCFPGSWILLRYSYMKGWNVVRNNGDTLSFLGKYLRTMRVFSNKDDRPLRIRRMQSLPCPHPSPQQIVTFCPVECQHRTGPYQI